MNFQKSVLIVLSTVALYVGHSDLARAETALAEAKTEKALRLEVQSVDAMTLKLSASAPLEGKEEAIRLELGDDLLDLVKAEQLKNVVAEFRIFQANGTIIKHRMIIGPNNPKAAVVQLSEFIVSASANVSVGGNFPMLVRPRAIPAKYDFKTLAQCSGVRVEQATDHPEIRRLVLAEQIALTPGVDLEVSITAKVLPGDHFFAANLENFGSTHTGIHYPGARLELIREHNSLKLRKGPAGRLYDVYIFDHGCSF